MDETTDGTNAPADGLDAAEWLLSRFESDDEVAFAEVGCLDRDHTTGSTTPSEVRFADDLSHVGVWWRVFAEGSADYRFTTSFSESHLEDLVERSIRSARVLDQNDPAQYDVGTMHRAIHPGWTTGESLSDRTADEKLATVQSAFAGSLDGLTFDRAVTSYRDERLRTTLLTTTGTTVRTSIERASVEAVITPAGAEPVQRHFGATTGATFLDSLPERFDTIVSTARRRSEWPMLDRDLAIGDRVELVFSPRAAAELFHGFTHYLEADSVYFGSSPYAIGDRFGPSMLDIEDCVHAGSWGALAYDIEGRPAMPVPLVSDGIVRNYLHDTVSALEEGTVPMGSVVPSVGYERPPRIHARHVDVARGNDSDASLLDGADLYIEAVESPRIDNEATRTKRASSMPPSVPYAKDIAATTPSEFADEATSQTLSFPVRFGYTIDDGERTRGITDGLVTVSPSDVRSMSAIGNVRETVTGVCSKHRSMLPYAVTSPAVRVSARFSHE
ncbi:metallopeptidase TldD-related protein [Haladaptatus sp. AB643]|uniref:metallopeptidase TldD-related protein n=1 Tax=Haladaptatus sp. AB643 TaxID=2934174 RepID=UPI00209BD14C|nr:metallopeptidase TldD-related protein [Haladaptatus sp. AB643]MCO8246445.1 metallopeptidase TldD-related protein [Haladaptatus sp. AB643]